MNACKTVYTFQMCEIMCKINQRWKLPECPFKEHCRFSSDGPLHTQQTALLAWRSQAHQLLESLAQLIFHPHIPNTTYLWCVLKIRCSGKKKWRCVFPLSPKARSVSLLAGAVSPVWKFSEGPATYLHHNIMPSSPICDSDLYKYKIYI